MQMTLTISGESFVDLQKGVIHAADILCAGRIVSTHVELPPAAVAGPTATAVEEPPAKEKAKRGRPAKEAPPEMVVTKETPGPEKTDTFLPEQIAKPAPATGATYESMKQALQKLAGAHKSNEEGMAAVKKLLGTFSITMVRDVPAEKYQTVQDAAMNAISEMGTGAAADPFAPK